MPIVYEVKQGDCIDSIALEHGFFPDVVWNHPDNGSLKRDRKDPNVLYPGDKVTIPDLEEKTQKVAEKKKHRFRRKGVPEMLRLTIRLPVDEEEEDDQESAAGEDDESCYEDPEEELEVRKTEPVADTPYSLQVDGDFQEGTTDGEGKIEVKMPPNARTGKLVLNPGTPDERTINLELGSMDPVETFAGARKRLNNLGYRCLPDGEEMSSDLADALARFQKAMELDTTGELDAATKDKLKTGHGS